MYSEMDKELRQRLSSYTREPDERLWGNIAPHINVRRRNRINRTSEGIDLFTIFLLVAFALSSFENFPHTNASYFRANLLPIDTKINTQSKEEIAAQTSIDASIPRESNNGANKSPTLTTEPFESVTKMTSRDKGSRYVTAEAVIKSDNEIKLRKIDSQDIEVNPEIISTNSRLIGNGNVTVKNQHEPAEKVTNRPAVKVEEVIKNNKQTRRKFDVYVTAMPTFGYQRIESKTNDNIYVESVKKISAFSTERLGIRAELGVEIPIAKRFKVFSGIVYFQRKQTIDYTEMQVDTTVVSTGPNGEYIVETELIGIGKSFEYELRNMGIQIGLNYELKRRRFLQSLGTGIEFQFALNKLAEEHKQNFTNNPSAYVFYNLYYRLQYPSEGRLKAVFQPTLNYSFYINEDLNAPFYVKPYGLGLNIGLTYNF